jgi:hypothetical protein
MFENWAERRAATLAGLEVERAETDERALATLNRAAKVAAPTAILWRVFVVVLVMMFLLFVFFPRNFVNLAVS